KVFERLSFKKIKFVILSRNKKPISEKSKSIELKELKKEDVAKFLEQSLKSSNFSSDLLDFLYERSSGNPFYLKEILSILIEKGIVKVDKENFVIFDPEKAFSLSRSLEDILLMRIDALSSVEKNLIKVASCFGDTFEINKVSQIFVPKLTEDEIRDILKRVEHLGITKISEKEFKFSSKILRETAYNSILVSNKKSIHRQIGELFEKEEGEKAHISETLSYHFGIGEEFQKAFDYSLISARKSFSQQQFYKAQKFYSLSLEYGQKVGKAIDEKELLDYLKSLITTREYEKAEGIIEELEKSCDEEIVSKAKFYWITMLDQKGEYEKELEESKRLIEASEKRENGEIVVLTYKYAISALIRLGKYDDALKWTEEGFKRILEYNKEEETPNFYILFGSSLYAKGEYQKAQKYYMKAKENSEVSKNYETSIRSFFGLSNCYLALNEPEKALEYADKAHKMSKYIGSTMNIMGSATLLVNSLYYLSEYNKCLEVLKNVSHLATNDKFPYFLIGYFNSMGGAYFALKQYRQALQNFKKSLKISFKISNIQFIVNSYYNICECLKSLGQKERAKKHLMRLIKKYAISIDKNILFQIASEMISISDNEQEKMEFIKILKNCAKKLNDEDFFNNIIKST
ncbi:MAG: tetratricopeptide repeat protein, partial [Acidobacteria bacterium]|nr:tetratricopeptide repeat protein [Acidobacteriota bacterium]